MIKGKDDFACGHREWFIVFSSRPRDVKPLFIHRLLTPRDWSHVWAFCWDPVTGIYLTIDPRGNNIFVQPVPVQFTPGEVLKEIMERENTTAVVQFTKQAVQDYGFKWHGWHTCVTVIKDLLGIGQLSIQTPLSLFFYLLKSGGILHYFKKGVSTNVINVFKTKDAGHFRPTKTD